MIRFQSASVSALFVSLILVVVSAISPLSAEAGPNENGVLVLALAESVEYTGADDYCGDATATACENIQASYDGSDLVVIHALAAFPEATPPSLTGVTFGIQYPAGDLAMFDYGTCADFDFPTKDWPASGAGTEVSFADPQTDSMIEVYWFAAYTESVSGFLLEVVGHPVFGALFDDSVPRLTSDPISALGSFGFAGMDGVTPCPASGPTGACCFFDGTCTIEEEVDCNIAKGSYEGDGTDCDPNPCPQPEGACCFGLGSCSVQNETNCNIAGGSWLGDGTDCDPNLCPQPTGACCFEDGTCIVLEDTDCLIAGGSYEGHLTDCDPNPCPVPPGACCFSDGTCQELFEFECGKSDGDFQGPGEPCTPNPCPDPIGACCFIDGTCIQAIEPDCEASDGEYQGPEVPCIPDPCPQPECSLDPTSIDFAGIAIGTSEDRTFTITNVGGSTLSGEVTEECPVYEFIGDTVYSLTPGQSQEFTIRFSPVIEGQVDCDVDPGANCSILPVTGRGEQPPFCLVSVGGGLAEGDPADGLDPDRGGDDSSGPLVLVFGPVEIGTTAEQTFTITNGGGATLSGTVSESCDDYSFIGDTSFSLTAGVSKVFTVEFAPTSETIPNCVIETGTECANLLAIGSGFPSPECLVEPTLINFGNVGISQFEDQPFTITNTGGGVLSGSISEGCPEYAIVGSGSYSLESGESQGFTLRYSPQVEGVSSCNLFLGPRCEDLEAVGSGQPQPACDISPSNLDFGIVALGDSKDITFTIENVGGGIITGTVSESCPQYKIVGPAGYTLTAGQSQSFTVRFTPTTDGLTSCTISTGGCSNVPATGTGEPSPDCLFSPAMIVFGDVEVGQSVDKTFKLTNSGGMSLAGELSLIECDGFSIVGDPGYELGRGEFKQFTLRFAPTSTGGTLCAIRTDEASCDDFMVSGTGTPSPNCSVSTLELDFGIVQVGSSKDLSFDIENTGGGVLEGTVESDCSEFVVIGGGDYLLESGEIETVLIRYSPIAVSPSECSISVGGACGSVAVLGIGDEPPSCDVTPLDLDFGSVPLGTSGQQVLTITNVGGGTLSGTVSSSCSEYNVIGTAGYDLTSGQSQEFTIEFTPVSEGLAECEIETGACESATATGIGLGVPICEVSRSNIDFGTVPIGQSVDEEFTIRNVGTGTLTGTVSSVCPGVSVSGGSYSLGPNQVKTITVTYAPTDGAALDCDLDTGDSCAAVSLFGGGDLPPTCMVSKSELLFGTVKPGEIEQRTFEITNAGGGTLEGTVSVACAEFSVIGDASYSLGGSQSATITIQFSPSALGESECNVATGADCEGVLAKGAGGGTPICELSPGSLEFGNVAVGLDTEKTFTITNVGEGVLAGRVDEACGEFAVIGATEYSLGSGESQEFTVRFSPSEVGDAACDLDTDADCGLVALTGTGLESAGACCFADGSCEVLTETGCLAQGGLDWNGLASCDDVNCVAIGACCFEDGSCSVVTEASCVDSGGEYSGDGSDCDPDPCPSFGACCYLDGSCSIETEAECESTGGVSWTVDASCDDVGCVTLGACCFPDGSCSLREETACVSSGGINWNPGSTCEDISCDPIGACCLDTGGCSLATEVGCEGDYQGDGSVCEPDLCTAVGACCDDDGGCAIASETKCAGTFFGDGVPCDPDPCLSKVEDVAVVTTGNGTEMRVTTTSAEDVEDLRGWYRIGGRFEYQAVAAFVQEGATWVADFNSADNTIRGIEYYLTYIDTDLNLIVSHGEPNRPQRLAVEDALPVPPILPLTLRMVAAPMVADDADVFGVLMTDLFGNSGSRSWRMGTWNSSAERYDMVDQNNPQAMGVGTAYWMGFGNAQDLWLMPGHTSFPPDRDEMYPRSMAPGWNMVGNPAAYTITLDPSELLVDDNGTILTFAEARSSTPPLVSDIYVYDPGLPVTAPFYPYKVAPSDISAWGGTWVQNRTNRELVLLVPAREAGLLAAVALLPDGTNGSPSTSQPQGTDRSNETLGYPSFASETDWAHSIRVSSAEDRFGLVLGMNDGASAGLDSHDLFLPPNAPGATLRVGWSGATDGLLLRDVRPRHQSDHLWQLELDANSEIDLAWANPVNEEWKLELVDPISNRSWDMSELHSIQLPAGSHRVEIRASRSEGPTDLERKFQVAIEPNPFRDRTLVHYTLPASGSVSLEIYSATGQRIWHRSESAAAAGEHVLVWEGRDQEGVRVPTGTYFLRMRANGETETVKFVAIR